jgi:predicted nucleotidyltransferase
MLTNEQIEDMTGLRFIARQFSAEMVIIGAAALRCFIELGRFTRDIDVAVALELDDFAAFSAELQTQGWKAEPAREHRWRGPRSSLVDLLPAGPSLRASGQLIWPDSQFAMSLAGFEHVFARAVSVPFAPDARFKVAPPPVIALLKIVAYMEDSQRRAKDLTDLKMMLHTYDASSDRIFGDDVFAADLTDIEYANAFLLGSDVGRIATHADAEIVHAFLAQHLLPVAERAELDERDPDQRGVVRLQMQFLAFEKGLKDALPSQA